MSEPITLYQFPTGRDVFSVSPFCAKLEAFIRWQQIPYQSVVVTDMKKAPKGKVPYIQDGNDYIGDSHIIIEHLCLKYGLDPDASLTAEQKAVARAVRYMCEESLYRIMAYMRFVDDTGWSSIRTLLMPNAPKWVRLLLLPHIRRYVTKQLTQQGIARHSRDEIIAIAKGDLHALNDLLGQKPYLFGDTMTIVDLVIFSVIANLNSMPFTHPVCEQVASLPQLVAHAERVKKQCFSPS